MSQGCHERRLIELHVGLQLDGVREFHALLNDVAGCDHGSALVHQEACSQDNRKLSLLETKPDLDDARTYLVYGVRKFQLSNRFP